MITVLRLFGIIVILGCSICLGVCIGNENYSGAFFITINILSSIFALETTYEN